MSRLNQHGEHFLLTRTAPKRAHACSLVSLRAR